MSVTEPTAARAVISASRQMRIKDEKGGALTLGHLRALVNMAEHGEYPDDTIVYTMDSNPCTNLTLREGH